MSGEAKDIMSPDREERVAAEIRPDGRLLAKLTIEQLAEYARHLVGTPAHQMIFPLAEPLATQPVAADTDEEPQIAVPRQGEVFEWLRKHSQLRFSNTDVVAALRGVTPEVAERWLKIDKGDDNFSNRRQTNIAINEALKALAQPPSSYTWRESQKGKTSQKHWRISAPGHSLPPEPGTLPEAAE